MPSLAAAGALNRFAILSTSQALVATAVPHSPPSLPPQGPRFRYYKELAPDVKGDCILNLTPTKNQAHD